MKNKNEERKDTCCADCDNYFSSDLYCGEYYCEAKKEWFGGKFKVIHTFAINKCEHFKDSQC